MKPEVIGAIASIIGAICSFIFAAFSHFEKKKTQSLSNEANNINKAKIELELRTLLATAQNERQASLNKINESTKGENINKLPKTQQKELKVYIQGAKASTENYLNDHEVACRNYLNKTVNQESFKKIYFHEIRLICEKDDLAKELLLPESTSNYEAIWKIYKEWHRLEK